MKCAITFAAMCAEFDARIIIGDEDTYYSDMNSQDPTYYIDGNLAAGRIELCLKGIWNPVCQDFWSEDETAVVCHQLGFSRYGTCLILYAALKCMCLGIGALVGDQKFPVGTEGMPELIQRTFECEGTEEHLSSCLSMNETNPNCGDVKRNAYIVCQGRDV